MKVVAITSSGKSENEVKRIIALFDNGLEVLHLRKPKLSTKEIEAIIKRIPNRYHNRIMIHGRYHLAKKYKLRGIHLRRKHRNNKLSSVYLRLRLRLFNSNLKMSTTFHSLQSLRENKTRYDYVFLSNVFNSTSRFNLEDSGMKLLQNVISKSNQNVYAIGGVDDSHIRFINKANFTGAGLSSNLFKQKQESAAIKELHDFLVA